MNAARLVLPCVLLGFAMGAHAQTQVALTKHNLTASGPGTIKTANATGLCIFCHTPHNATLTRALWNKSLPARTYQLYSSSTTKATLNQPTGSSRFCLSCHDGILALEVLNVPPKGMTLTTLGPLTGPTVLGTNLSGEHPVSFVYDAALATTRGNLRAPASISPLLHLDDTAQMQCTTCHNPHENRHPNFLRMDDTSGALCLSCHLVTYWGASTHSLSLATWNGLGASPWIAGAPATVALNACQNCHRPHAAGHPQRLLAQTSESVNCTICHNGNVAAKAVDAEFRKLSIHPIDSYPWVHDTAESPLTMPRHVSCEDCHNPHAANATPGIPPAASGRLAGVSGISITGAPLAPVKNEYEVCFKCHGLVEPTTPGITRADATRNIRLRTAPSNPSFHPVAAPGVNTTIAGLIPPNYTSASIITCTSCHDSDDAPSTPTAPVGPHGSLYSPILERQYLTTDPQPYAASSYDLCFKCHDPTTLLSPTNTFRHDVHVVKNSAECAACHDAHGSRQNPHLVDFMLRDRNGAIVVAPLGTATAPAYLSTGVGHGQCSLVCHNSTHSARAY